MNRLDTANNKPECHLSFAHRRYTKTLSKFGSPENQASTSWKVSLGEVSMRIKRAVDPLETFLDPSDSLYDPLLCRARLEELIRAQADTWMGILISRDYPHVARRYFGDLIPGPIIPEELPDRDEAFRAFRVSGKIARR